MGFALLRFALLRFALLRFTSRQVFDGAAPKYVERAIRLLGEAARWPEEAP